MKRHITLLSAILLTGTLAFARAGKEGGGGQGILCSANGVQTVTPLDLYEAQNIWGATIPSSRMLEDEIARVLPNDKLFSAQTGPYKEAFAVPAAPTAQEKQEMLTAYNAFASRLRVIPKNTHLTLSDDNGGLILQPPTGCQLVQVLYYADENDDSGQILVDNDYWNLLTPQSRLAFYFHEDIYKLLRRSGESDSTRARRVVGMLFDSKSYPGPSIELQGLKSAMYCSVYSQGVAIAFYAFPAAETIHAVINPGTSEAVSVDSPEHPMNLIFMNLGVSGHMENVLVSTTALSMWSYENFVSGHYETGSYVQGTKSVMGSETLMLDFVDRSCLGTKKRCQPTIKIQDENQKWVGGPVSCRMIK